MAFFLVLCEFKCVFIETFQFDPSFLIFILKLFAFGMSKDIIFHSIFLTLTYFEIYPNSFVFWHPLLKQS